MLGFIDFFISESEGRNSGDEKEFFVLIELEFNCIVFPDGMEVFKSDMRSICKSDGCDWGLKTHVIPKIDSLFEMRQKEAFVGPAEGLMGLEEQLVRDENSDPGKNSYGGVVPELGPLQKSSIFVQNFAFFKV